MEKYGKTDASLSKGGAKDKAGYSDLGGIKAAKDKKSAPLDGKASECKQKDSSCYPKNLAKEAGAE